MTSSDDTDLHGIRRQSEKIAGELWNRLCKNVGELEAKEIMRRVMGTKKPGPRMTDEDRALGAFIYSYICRCGLDLADRKIAKHIFESKPYYVEFDSGAIAVVNNEITEAYMKDDDEVIVDRRPMKKSLTAIEKQVERIRRWTIEDDILPKEYAPRPYHRD